MESASGSCVGVEGLTEMGEPDISGGSMRQGYSSVVARAALLSAAVFSCSCSSLGNFILNGTWQEPSTEEASEPQKSASPTASGEQASADESKADTAKAAPEPALQVFPSEKTLVYGAWSLYRDSKAVFAWTGKDASLRVVMIELDTSHPCWTSRKADGPRVLHCPNGTSVIASDLNAVGIAKDKQSPAANDLLSGSPNPPWRSKTAGEDLAEGNYDLPETSGAKKGTFSLEATAKTLTIRMPRALSEDRALVLSKDSPNAAFQGYSVDFFDGCTNADGSLPVYLGIGLQMGKRSCGFSLNISGDDATLTQGPLSIEITTLQRAPDIAKVREKAAELRKTAAQNNAQLDLRVEGDATYTLVTARGKSRQGDVFAFAESEKTIGDEYFRCSVKLEGPDTALLPTAKQICASMRAVK